MAKDKLPQIKRKFEKAAQIIHNPEELKKLKRDSPLWNFCLGIKQYMSNQQKRGCTTIYDIFHVRPWRKKDEEYTNYIKETLYMMKNPAATQTEFKFTTS